MAERPPDAKQMGVVLNREQPEFNAELLELDQQPGDRVVVHELLHFFVPNHGKLWKSLMRAYLGEYEALDGRLKKRASEGRT